MGEFDIRLMVVDDSELWHDQVRQILEQYPGLEIVATAQTGEEAIIKARLRHPDVIVMDLGLPEMSGFEAAKQIREEFSEVKFVFFSVQSNPATISAVLSLKGSAYVTKARGWADLARAIKNVVS